MACSAAIGGLDVAHGVHEQICLYRLSILREQLSFLICWQASQMRSQMAFCPCSFPRWGKVGMGADHGGLGHWGCPHPYPLPEGEGEGEGANGTARSSGADQARAERSDGPSEEFKTPSGRAEKRRAWGGRSEACASCSDSLPLFERRERSEQSEFGSAAPRASIAGCPAGDTASGAAFLCLLSLAEQRK